ncbi:MAG: pyridoxamine 5'-phosphate oxidase family protein [Oscillospiraceae bacterium]|jgi:general stress protein 26|nr:pyridoxamine 5'-phosphate oxidase family protein [Oscillospiraceae bacterium]
MSKTNERALTLMTERFGHDTFLYVATIDGDRPSVRTVNAFYENGAFYVVTYALSGKIKQIEKNPAIGVCGEWFTAHGIGENLGHVLAPQNAEMMTKIRTAFAEWYDNGHTNESDPNTVLLRIRLTDGILFHHGERFEIDFTVE